MFRPRPDDRFQTVGKSPANFFVHRLVGFVEISALFRVAENDIGHSQSLEHVAGDFSGESALRFPMHILRTEQNLRSPRPLSRLDPGPRKRDTRRLLCWKMAWLSKPRQFAVASSADSSTVLCIFQLPARLLVAFWRMISSIICPSKR